MGQKNETECRLIVKLEKKLIVRQRQPLITKQEHFEKIPNCLHEIRRTKTRIIKET